MTEPKGPGASRRSFLRTSAAAVSAAALSPLPIPSVHAAGSGTIKIGMIGCGGRCTGAAEDALNAGPDVQLTAMADVFEHRVKGSLQQLKKTKTDQVKVDPDRCFVGFDGYKKVIECSDAVLIACASKFHARYARAALEAGKHVFVEKPHAIDTAGIKELEAAIRIAKEKKLSLVSGLQSRYHPLYKETIQQIHDGAIGDIVTIEETWLRGPYGLNARRPGQKEMEYQFSNWYHFCWLSGDDVIQTLTHNLDRSTWVMKGQTPVRAHGLGGRSASFGEVYGDMFDHHTVVYEYANGARLYASCRTVNNCHNDNSTRIYGTKGRCDLFAGKIEGEKPWKYSGPGGNPYRLEHKALMDSIRSGTPINNGEYMIPSTLVVIMGQVACYTGKLVKWDDLVQSNFSFGPLDGNFDMEPPTKPGPDGNYPLPIPGKTKLI
jgi:predicted dehydrogenase